MQKTIEFLTMVTSMGCNPKKKNMGSKKILKNYQMGCQLLEIKVDGLYAIFHIFEADLWAY